MTNKRNGIASEIEKNPTVGERHLSSVRRSFDGAATDNLLGQDESWSKVLAGQLKPFLGGTSSDMEIFAGVMLFYGDYMILSARHVVPPACQRARF
jgi:hypothetical protein